MTARGLHKSLGTPEQRELQSLMIEARTLAGMTQQELARRLKRHQSFIAKYEGGERRIDVLEFVRILQVLGEDPIKVLRNLIKRIA